LELGRRKGDKWIVGLFLSDLAFVRVLAGLYAEAEDPAPKAIMLFHELQDRYGTAYTFGTLAGAHAAPGRAVRAVRLWGAMEGLLDSLGAPLQFTHKESIGDRLVNPIRESIGEEAFHAALSEGRAMSLTQAAQYVLTEASDDRPRRDLETGPGGVTHAAVGHGETPAPIRSRPRTE
jgi:hypothetical protein